MRAQKRAQKRAHPRITHTQQKSTKKGGCSRFIVLSEQSVSLCKGVQAYPAGLEMNRANCFANGHMTPISRQADPSEFAYFGVSFPGQRGALATKMWHGV